MHAVSRQMRSVRAELSRATRRGVVVVGSRMTSSAKPPPPPGYWSRRFGVSPATRRFVRVAIYRPSALAVSS